MICVVKEKYRSVDLEKRKIRCSIVGQDAHDSLTEKNNKWTNHCPARFGWVIKMNKVHEHDALVGLDPLGYPIFCLTENTVIYPIMAPTAKPNAVWVGMSTGNSSLEVTAPNPSPRRQILPHPRPREGSRGELLSHPRPRSGIKSPRGSPSPRQLYKQQQITYIKNNKYPISHMQITAICL